MQFGWIYPVGRITERKLILNQTPHLGIELENGKEYYLMFRSRWGRFKAPRQVNFYFSVDPGVFALNIRSYVQGQERARVEITNTHFRTYWNGSLLNQQSLNFPSSGFLVVSIAFTPDQRYETRARAYSDSQFFNLTFSTSLNNTEQHAFMFSASLNNAGIYFHKAEIRR